MTIRHLQLGPGLAARLGLCALLMAVGAPVMGAEPAPTEGRTAAPALPAKKSADPASASAKPVTATAAKAKPRPRRGSKSAKPAKVAAPEPAKESDAEPIQLSDAKAASAKPTQVVDFDADEVDGKRLEPGFELIQAAPRRARQPSLVTPLRPEDSVVGRE